MKKDIERKLIADIHEVPVFERHLLKKGEYIGNIHIPAIVIWSDRIEVLVDIRRNVFKKAIDKFVEEHEDVLRFAYFVSRPEFAPYVVFWVKKEYQ